jgi:hypothetical protein
MKSTPLKLSGTVYKTVFKGCRVSEWLLFNANSAIFQQYHGENKLILNEMRWGLLYNLCYKLYATYIINMYKKKYVGFFQVNFRYKYREHDSDIEWSAFVYYCAIKWCDK